MPTAALTSSAADPRARHLRAEVWSTLVGICRSLEQLQTEPEKKEACRAVREELAAQLARERGVSRRRR